MGTGRELAARRQSREAPSEGAGVAGCATVPGTQRVAVVLEEDLPTRAHLKVILEAEGLSVVLGEPGKAGLAEVAIHMPDIVLIDVSAQATDPLQILRSMREWAKAPIIALSSSASERDKVFVLDAGADDYVVKPFSARELLARIRVALRRSGRESRPASGPVLTVGELRIDLPYHRVTLKNETIRLTPTEFKILALLARYPDAVLTHADLAREIWGNSKRRGHADLLRVYIGQLRRKIEPDLKQPRYIVTETGVGYRLAGG